MFLLYLCKYYLSIDSRTFYFSVQNYPMTHDISQMYARIAQATKHMQRIARLWYLGKMPTAQFHTEREDILSFIDNESRALANAAQLSDHLSGSLSEPLSYEEKEAVMPKLKKTRLR